jgi:hypothetical protein
MLGLTQAGARALAFLGGLLGGSAPAWTTHAVARRTDLREGYLDHFLEQRAREMPLGVLTLAGFYDPVCTLCAPASRRAISIQLTG